MINRTMKHVLLFLAIAVLFIASAQSEKLTQTLSFEAQRMNLDTGEVSESRRLIPTEEPGEATWDIVIVFHGDRPVHAVLAPNAAAGIERGEQPCGEG